MMDVIDAMEKDQTVKVLVVISKPPAKSVRDKIAARLSVLQQACSLPIPR